MNAEPAGAPVIQERLLVSLASLLAKHGEAVRLIETHISWILLAGGHAWKIKKALDLGFLDFSTLERRRFFCEEELRLNRRLAPELYEGMVAIAGTPAAPRLVEPGAPEEGAVFEYAVRMKRFRQSDLMDRMLESGTLRPAHLDELAGIMARFHGGLTGGGDGWGHPEQVFAPLAQVFGRLRGLGERGPELTLLEDWCGAHFHRLAGRMEARRREGFVRECHGDLHLGNVAVVDGRVRVFDGIEFSPDLRWIDIQSDVAFLVMDLAARGRPDYAFRFLDAWLQWTGDHGGLALQVWYQVYRALVRAMVARLRMERGIGVESAREDFRRHLGLALALGRPARTALILTHGYSGAGKTTVSQALLESLGAIRLRSDVERKRLHGLAMVEASGADSDSGLYGKTMDGATYGELLRRTRQVLDAGFPVIVDATFLRRDRREGFQALARRRGIPFLIIDCLAEEDALRRRLVRRLALHCDASDATPEVLAQQLASAEALTEQESPFVLAWDSAAEAPSRIVERVRERLGWD